MKNPQTKPNYSEQFHLRTPEKVFTDVLKIASKKDKSINETINRLLNSAIMREQENEPIYFEMQYVDINERFGFKSDHEDLNKKEKPVYRFCAVNKNNGNFICQNVGTKATVEFKFSQFFYKPIFLI